MFPTFYILKLSISSDSMVLAGSAFLHMSVICLILLCIVCTLSIVGDENFPKDF